MFVPHKRLLATLCVTSLFNLGCFTSYRISLGELEKLQTGYEAERVPVVIDHCGEGQATGEPVQVASSETDFETAATGCPVVYVTPTSPISVVTTGGRSHRITPFNFVISETQLVSPDYDLLLPRSDLAEAEVDMFSTGKTVALIAGITAVAVGSFLAISLLAPPERGLGGR
ncbi:MAG: hypothetical protein JW797_16425 [Bradymonadales bacterium]|nr:hypothetical protein [Bradymonadales bacterium]